jgi:glycosyltransferase involved in cell wall biosynthesis
MVGAKRFSFLTREFTRQGFDVHVIARDAAHGRPDTTLPLQGTVHRVPNPFELPREGAGCWRRLVNAVFRRVLAPVGLEYFWARAATRKAVEVARSLPTGVIIATSPPHAALLAGARAARRLGWPLILDYRDPWSAYDWPDWHRGGLSQWLARRIETRVVRASAARVLNTPSMREWFEERFGFARASDNHVIPNGFDAGPPAPPSGGDGPLRILHAGEIYGSRSLLPVLQAVAKLKTRHPERRIHVVCYGLLPQGERQRVLENGLGHLIEERPRIPFKDLFAELQRAHVLLALVSEHMTYSTPYKVYDYLSAGRPILGLAPREAALHELLVDSGAGIGVAPGDAAGIERALEQLLFSGARLDPARLDRFHWSHLAQRYRTVIEEVRLTTRAQGREAAAGRPLDA